VHYLAKNKRTEFADYLRDVSKLGPFEGSLDVTPPGIVRANRDLFVKHFGGDLADLENRLVLHLKKQPYTDPFADAPHFVATLISGDARRPQRSVNTFHSPTLAQKWLRDLVEQLPADQRPSANTAIRIFPNRAQAEVYARQWQGGR
jgi:hypothetical protein